MRWTDGNAAYDKPAVKANAGRVVGEVEIAYELIHVGKELGECDWFNEPDGAECCKLAFWDGGGRGRCKYLRLEEGTSLVEMAVGADGSHGEEGKSKETGVGVLRFLWTGMSSEVWLPTRREDEGGCSYVHGDRGTCINGPHGQIRACRRGRCRDCLTHYKPSAPGSERLNTHLCHHLVGFA